MFSMCCQGIFGVSLFYDRVDHDDSYIASHNIGVGQAARCKPTH
jgi:hypothetical protein